MTDGIDRLGDIFRRLANLADKAEAALETARDKAGRRSSRVCGDDDPRKPTVESRMSIRTLDGAPVDVGNLFGALARSVGSEGGDAEQAGQEPSKPLREAVIETVHDAPDAVTAVVELPGASEDGLEIIWEDDMVRLGASSAHMDYHAEALLPRSVAGMTFERSLRNGVLEMRWYRAGGDGA